MLVLTRKSSQSIVIGDDVEIIVVEVRGDQVRLGIKAPRSIPVHRKEVFEEIRQENLRAASGPAEVDVEEIGRSILAKSLQKGA